MPITMSTGALTVTEGTKTKFTTSRQYPAVMYQGTRTGFQQIFFYTIPNSLALVPNYWYQNNYILASKGTHYLETPDFVYGNFDITLSGGRNIKGAINGSYPLDFVLGPIRGTNFTAPGQQEFYVSSGFALIAKMDLYVNGSGHIELQYRHGLSDLFVSRLSDYPKSKQLSDIMFQSCNYLGLENIGGTNYEKWEHRFTINSLNYIVGKFTG